jgi:hypothetical protein
MNVVDMNGQPVTANYLGSLSRKGARHIGIDAEVALRLREVDPTKLLGHLGAMLPVGDLEWQALFVLDYVQWLRSAADVLLTQADHLEESGSLL